MWSDGGFVFRTAVGTPLDSGNVTRAYHRVCERAGLGKRAVKDLRHSAATALRAAGVPMADISRILGHSWMTITETIYAAMADDAQRRAAAAMETAFGVDPAAPDRKASSS